MYKLESTLFMWRLASGTETFRKFYLEMKESGGHYDFIEVMACPGGCGWWWWDAERKMPKVMAVQARRSLYKRDGGCD